MGRKQQQQQQRQNFKTQIKFFAGARNSKIKTDLNEFELKIESNLFQFKMTIYVGRINRYEPDASKVKQNIQTNKINLIKFSLFYFIFICKSII